MSAAKPHNEHNYNLGKPVGRPSRLNTRVAQSIINSLGSGSYAETACRFAGITPSTYALWRRRGIAELERVGEGAEETVADMAVDTRDGQSVNVPFSALITQCPEGFNPDQWPYVVFQFLTEKAKATAELRAVTSIQSAGEQQWQAHAWFLERTHPERYGRHERLALEGVKDGAPIQVSNVTIEDLEAAIERERAKDGH